MKPAPFEYRLARSVDEAIDLLAEGDGAAAPLAGGQTLGPLLNLRLAQPERVVDISRIEALAGWLDRGEHIELGACVTHARIEDRRSADPSRGLLPHVASGIAYRSVRNRGTLGGSLAYADPAAEWPTVMRALAARARIAGPRGERTLPMEEFVTGPMSTCLAPGELLLGVSIRKLGPAARWGFRKLSRKSGDFAEALAAVIIDGTARVVIGATPAGPLEMPQTARVVDALPPSGEVAAGELDEAFDADIDRAELDLDDYERRIHRHTLLGAIREALRP